MNSKRGSRISDSSDELVDQKIRPATEALKFVPAYRAEWCKVVAKHGRAIVRGAARRVRPARRGVWPTGTLYADLRELLRWSPMPLAAPVDPDDPDDDGGGIVRESGMYRSIRRVDIDRLRDLVTFSEGLGRVPGGNELDPWLILEVDLRSPLPRLAQEIGALRESLGMRTTRRPGNGLRWAELRVGFEMLRARQKNPEISARQLARRFLRWGPDHPQELQDAERRVRTLLRRAEDRVEGMTTYVDAGCPTNDPFLFADSTDS